LIDVLSQILILLQPADVNPNIITTGWCKSLTFCTLTFWSRLIDWLIDLLIYHFIDLLLLFYCFSVLLSNIVFMFRLPSFWVPRVHRWKYSWKPSSQIIQLFSSLIHRESSPFSFIEGRLVHYFFLCGESSPFSFIEGSPVHSVNQGKSSSIIFYGEESIHLWGG